MLKKHPELCCRFGLIWNLVSKCHRYENNEIIHIAGVQAYDDLFDRLENVRFYRLFTRDGDMEYLAAVIQGADDKLGRTLWQHSKQQNR
jgi:hypothetical protein